MIVNVVAIALCAFVAGLSASDGEWGWVAALAVPIVLNFLVVVGRPLS